MAKKKPKKGELRESAEKVWLAGLGALATAEEEGGKAFQSLVSKGERYQKTLKKPVRDAQKKVEGTVKDVRGRAGKTWQKVENAFDHQVTVALHRLGVPTRKEIADLSAQVEKLTRKLEGKPAAKKKTSTAKKPAKKPGTKKTAAKKKVAEKQET
jgi:poly(hydroxyalkanoate) granule-associated protein